MSGGHNTHLVLPAIVTLRFRDLTGGQRELEQCYNDLSSLSTFGWRF